MTDLINGRTPEEIKQELQWLAYGCRESNTECDECIHAEICSNVTERDAPCNALALIELLESERDEALAKVPKWISVEEKMPPEDTEVLVYATEKIKGFGSVTAICEYSETTSMFGNKTGRYDWSSPWEYFHVDYKITHWMPLPEPPEEDDHA